MRPSAARLNLNNFTEKHKTALEELSGGGLNDAEMKKYREELDRERNARVHTHTHSHTHHTHTHIRTHTHTHTLALVNADMCVAEKR